MNDIPKLYRIILQVSDMDKAEAFYTRLLDDRGRAIRGGRHYFDCGAVILAILDPSAGGELARPNADNVYFSVSDVEAVYGRAKALECLAEGDVHGAPAGEIVTRPWGERCFYVTDPFGNSLCFVDEETLFTGR